MEIHPYKTGKRAGRPSASDPWTDGLPPHVPARGPLPSVCLLPGDPARVALAGQVLEGLEEIGTRREFRLAVGQSHGRPIAVCSTGIGGPSTEIAVVELARLGVTTFLRIGGMGACDAAIPLGAATTVKVALRGGGTAQLYAPDDLPIPAHPAVLAAIEAAAAGLGTDVYPISVLSCDSYYVGEGRDLPGLESLADARRSLIESSGAGALDMETETVYAVARAIGCRYGAILAAHGNRATDEWLEDYEPPQLKVLRLAVDAAVRLTDQSYAGEEK